MSRTDASIMGRRRRQFRKSLAYSENFGDANIAARTYFQLAIIAQEQRDFAIAEWWYRKSLAIDERHGNERGVGFSYHNLGITAAQQEQYEQAGQRLIKAIQVFRCIDQHNTELSTSVFLAVHRKADRSTRNRLKTMWEEAGLGELPEPEEPTE